MSGRETGQNDHSRRADRGELLLGGGGDEEDAWLLDRHLAARLDGPIVFVPVGLPEERRDDAASDLRSALAAHGVGSVTTWRDLRGRTAADLDGVGAVHLGDGNAYRLLARLRRSGLAGALVEFVAGGGLLSARGAGAAVCGRSVRASRDEDVAGLRDDSGLALLGGWDVWPAHDPVADDLGAYVAEHDRPVLGLSRRTGVSVTPERCLAVGYEPVVVRDADGTRRVLPEEAFALG